MGNAFGLGFLGAPVPAIELKAEPFLPGEVFSGWIITNTMVTTWMAILVLTVLAFFATRRMTEVPTGLQNFFEVVIEYFLNLSESVAGPEKARKFLPLVLTIFLFIVTANWMGILPGFGTIGWIESVEVLTEHAEHEADQNGEAVHLEEINAQIFQGEGSLLVMPFGSIDNVTNLEEIEEHGLEEGQTAGILIPFLRSANTDINTTLAIALIAMFTIHFWGFRTLGFFGHAGKYITIKGGPIGSFVGLLELISEVARIISFTFRLFGNIFAGEVLLVAMAFLLPLIGIIPFLGLELFVGLIQAFIFAMLTLVFATMATAGHGDEHD